MDRMVPVYLVAAGLVLGFSGKASAQDVVIEYYAEPDVTIIEDDPDDAFEIEDDDVPVVDPPVVVRKPEPPVYGWVHVRPENCGTFRYWDGRHCVDARHGPLGD